MNSKASQYWAKALAEIEAKKETYSDKGIISSPSIKETSQKYSEIDNEDLNESVEREEFTSSDEEIELRDVNKSTSESDSTEYPSSGLDIYSKKLGKKLGSKG